MDTKPGYFKDQCRCVSHRRGVIAWRSTLAAPPGSLSSSGWQAEKQSRTDKRKLTDWDGKGLILGLEARLGSIVANCPLSAESSPEQQNHEIYWQHQQF